MTERERWIEEQVDSPDDSQITFDGRQLRRVLRDAMAVADATRESPAISIHTGGYGETRQEDGDV